MKKNIITSLIIGLVFAAIYSFTAIRIAPKNSAVKPEKAFTCSAGVTGAHIISNNGGTVTIGWSGVNSPAHYDYGGYFHCAGGFGPTTTTSTQCTISTGPGECGGTLVIRAFCSDGTLGGYQNIEF
ncbi:MAG: hypothetical protein JWR09_4657 [Mucilaginibacter sp.]|nr:hypothetical protein [Mucilaginibacter sp.]